jgi:hypothetical protein
LEVSPHGGESARPPWLFLLGLVSGSRWLRTVSASGPTNSPRGESRMEVASAGDGWQEPAESSQEGPGAGSSAAGGGRGWPARACGGRRWPAVASGGQPGLAVAGGGQPGLAVAGGGQPRLAVASGGRQGPAWACGGRGWPAGSKGQQVPAGPWCGPVGVLVEAAGLEPASEMTSPEGPTRVFDLFRSRRSDRRSTGCSDWPASESHRFPRGEGPASSTNGARF